MAELDRENIGSLSIEQVAIFLDQVRNVKIRSADLDREFKAFDLDGNGRIDNDEFRAFSLALEARPAIKDIYTKFAAGPRMTVAELNHFMVSAQGEDINEGGYRLSIGQDIMMPDQNGTIGFMQFQRMLLSPDNVCVPPCEMLEPVDDMNQPMGDYFINSSHNTYCSGDQLTDDSQVQMYINALLRGSRCVELDCWDPTVSLPSVRVNCRLASV